MLIRKTLAVCLFCVVGVLADAVESWAAPITYTFDTSSLADAGTYSLDFQLTSAENPTANSATLMDFQFGGGAHLGTSFYPPNGGYSGSVDAPPLVLTVIDPFNSFTQDFIPGASLSFTLDLTNVAPAGLFPDQFSFAILLDGLEVVTPTRWGPTSCSGRILPAIDKGPWCRSMSWRARFRNLAR